MKGLKIVFKELSVNLGVLALTFGLDRSKSEIEQGLKSWEEQENARRINQILLRLRDVSRRKFGGSYHENIARDIGLGTTQTTQLLWKMRGQSPPLTEFREVKREKKKLWRLTEAGKAAAKELSKK